MCCSRIFLLYSSGQFFLSSSSSFSSPFQERRKGRKKEKKKRFFERERKKTLFEKNKVLIFTIFLFLSELSEDKDFCLKERKKDLLKYSDLVGSIIHPKGGKVKWSSKDFEKTLNDVYESIETEKIANNIQIYRVNRDKKQTRDEANSIAGLSKKSPMPEYFFFLFLTLPSPHLCFLFPFFF